jgi:hypothetical protein
MSKKQTEEANFNLRGQGPINGVSKVSKETGTPHAGAPHIMVFEKNRGTIAV